MELQQHMNGSCDVAAVTAGKSQGILKYSKQRMGLKKGQNLSLKARPGSMPREQKQGENKHR